MMRIFPTTARTLFYTLALTLLIAAPQFAHAADGKPVAAASREEVKADSVKANAAEPKPPTAAEKTAATNAANDIVRFDPSLVIGAPVPGQIYYQPASSPIMQAVKPVHDYVMVVITIVTLFVLGLLAYIVIRFNKKANPKPATFTHNKTIEIIWTVIPILILVSIAIPSLRLHYQYYNNENIISNADVTIKVVGRQWYWSYEYPDHGIAFDSNIKADKDLVEGEPRLLAVDNPIVVPAGKTVRIQLTGADVMHAWAVPSFGIKKGAIPGRLNETWFKADKEGIYYGQCSILCGKSHGFMPIEIRVVSPEKFDAWVKGAKLKFASNTTLQFAALN